MIKIQFLNRTIFFPLMLLSVWPATSAAKHSPNRFSCKKCDSILALNSEATKTLRAIMEATNTKQCSDFKLDRDGKTNFSSMDLHEKGLTDLTPFTLFNFISGDINLSGNKIKDIRPLITAAGGLYTINLAHNEIEDDTLLNNFHLTLVLDDNRIKDPSKLGNLLGVSLRGNTSARGADYDRTLERLYDFYTCFPTTWEYKKEVQQVDFSRLRDLLAPKLSRYISMKNADVEDVIRDAQQYYQNKRDVHYIISLSSFKVERVSGHVIASYNVRYSWQDYEYQSPESVHSSRQVRRYKDVSAIIKVTFDSLFRITAYVEKPTDRKRFLVVEGTQGSRNFTDVAECLQSACVSLENAELTIPKGTTLMGDCETATNGAGGKFGTSDSFEKVIYKGRSIWVHAATSEGVDESEVGGGTGYPFLIEQKK